MSSAPAAALAVQAKLMIGARGDHLEREADDTAARVMSIPDEQAGAMAQPAGDDSTAAAARSKRNARVSKPASAKGSGAPRSLISTLPARAAAGGGALIVLPRGFERLPANVLRAVLGTSPEPGSAPIPSPTSLRGKR